MEAPTKAFDHWSIAHEMNCADQNVSIRMVANGSIGHRHLDGRPPVARREPFDDHDTARSLG